MCTNVEIVGEDVESEESWMLLRIRRALKSKGMHFSELRTMLEEESVRVVTSLHLQMNPFSGDMRAREEKLDVEFEKRRRGEESWDTENNRLCDEEIFE